MRLSRGYVRLPTCRRERCVQARPAWRLRFATAVAKVAVFSFLAATGCAWTLLASNSPNNVVTDIAETAGIFTGRVIDSATLLPLENVDVLVYDANGGFVGKTQTGPDGLFSSPLLPPASYFVRTFNARGYVDQVFGG